MALVRFRRRPVIVGGSEAVADVAVSGGAGGGGVAVAPGVVAAAAEANQIIRLLATLLAVAGVLIAYLGSLLLRKAIEPGPIELREEFTIFAIFYVVAQAIERGLEPFTTLLPPYKEKVATELEQTVATAANAIAENATNVDAAVTQAAAAKEKYDLTVFIRTFMYWAIATALGMLISGTIGLYFLATLVTNDPPPVELDIAVTGLVVGAGTKPLHDLITRISQAKEEGEVPPEARLTP